MNTEHTPGPWNTVGLNGGRIAIVAHDATDVATLTHANHADARLIAASPELLAALDLLVNLHCDWDKGTAYIPVDFMHKNNAAIAAARAAIARATGGEA